MNALRIAFDSIWSHRTRSALTALGVVIGVFAVVTLVSLGTGVRDYVQGQFKAVGADVFTVAPASPGSSSRQGAQAFGHGTGPFGAGGVPSTLTVADSDAITALHAQAIRRVAPLSQLPLAVSTGPGASPAAVAVYGTTAAYFPMQQLAFAHGGFAQSGVVLGSSAARTLFGATGDPVGREVRVGAASLRVRGVLRPGRGMLSGQANQGVYLPVRTGLHLAGLDTVSQILVEASGTAKVDRAATLVQHLLRRRHAQQDFEVTKYSQLLSTINSTLAVITSFLGGLAAISLLVGGIGIMNIMLVTVTERFREIGVRKALGARDGDILTQFLTESVLLAVLGGAVGLALSALASRIIGRIAGLPTGLTPGAVLLALAFSLAVGAVFGVLPALRAAHLTPADALRSE